MTGPMQDIRKHGVVAVIVQDGRFLVIRRAEFVRAPGMHCFPGGGIEAGESEAEAVRRELEEELALAGRPIERLWQSVTAWGVALAWWRVEIERSATITPNPLEVASYAWLTAEEIRGLTELLPSNFEFLDAWERGFAVP